MSIDEILMMQDRGEAYLALMHLFVFGSDAERDAIVRGWDFDLAWDYPDGHKLASTTPEQKGSPRDRIVAALARLAITKHSKDDRDDILALAIMYWSAMFAELDPNELFTLVASVGPPQSERLLMSFIERKPEDKSMKAFLLVKTEDRPGDIDIRVKWPR